MGRKEESMSMKESVVRYANNLDTREISRMNAQCQNIFSLLLEEWTKKKTEEIEIPLVEVKKKIGDVGRSGSRIEHQVESIVKMIVASSLVSGRDDKLGFICLCLIPRVRVNPERTKLIAKCEPEFLEIFTQLDRGFTQYANELFVRCRTKYAKNLFRLFARFYRGHVILSASELKQAMGMRADARGGDMIAAIRRGIDDLKKNGIYDEVTMKVVRGESRGSPIESVEFHYKMAENMEARLAGQGEIPGLEAGAAGPSPQAPAAAPSGDPGGGPAPFAAGEPPFTADDGLHGHIDPRTGLYIPSAEELAARHRPEDDKPSWRPAYSKPDIPETPPKCPMCGGEMVKRARNDGHEFWGCSRFPKCRGTRDLDGTDTSKK